jgi:hypothetical protein
MIMVGPVLVFRLLIMPGPALMLMLRVMFGPWLPAVKPQVFSVTFMMKITGRKPPA